jgi:hypothetical protein
MAAHDMFICSFEDSHFTTYLRQLNLEQRQETFGFSHGDVRGRLNNRSIHIHAACVNLQPVMGSLVNRLLTGEGHTTSSNPYARDFTFAGGNLAGDSLRLVLPREIKNQLCRAVRKIVKQVDLEQTGSTIGYLLLMTGVKTFVIKTTAVVERLEENFLSRIDIAISPFDQRLAWIPVDDMAAEFARLSL